MKRDKTVWNGGRCLQALALAAVAAAVLCILLGAAAVPDADTYGAAGERFDSGGITYEIVTDAGGDVPGTVKAVAVSGSPTTVPGSVENAGKNYNVVGIDDGCFLGCSSLETVGDLPACVTIGNDAFAGCSGLETVGDLPVCNGIPMGVFYDCTKLTAIGNLPACTILGDSAFYNCSSLETVGDLPACTTIGLWAFGSCSNLTAIGDLPACTSISESAFVGCSKLKTIGVLNAYETVPGFVFTDCVALETIGGLPACTRVEDSAFSGCKALKTIGNVTGQITIPNCAFIGIDAFVGCENINHFVIPCGIENVGSFFVDHFSERPQGPVKVTFADGSVCKSLVDGCFSGCSKLVSVYLPEGIETIGETVFDSCDALSEVFMPTTLSNIDARAFDGFTIIKSGQTIEPSQFNQQLPGHILLGEGNKILNASSAEFSKDTLKYRIVPGEQLSVSVIGFVDPAAGITELTVPSNVRYDDVTSEYDVLGIDGSAFEGNAVLQTVVAESVKDIGPKAFGGCTSLRTVGNLPACTSIGDGAFMECTSLQSVGSLPECLSIGSRAFYNETSSDTLKTVGNTVDAVSLPKCITIGFDAFLGCKGLEAVNDLTCCTNVGSDAFAVCSGLVTVGNLPVCETIGERAFSGCQNLQSVGNLSACREFPGNLFYNCTNLKTVGDMTGCRTFPVNLFETCTSLVSVGDLSSCTSIPISFFQNNTGLVSVGDLSACTSVGNNAFAGCSLLKTVGSTGDTVSLPACTSLGAGSFSGCSSLTSVGNLSVCASVGEKAFYMCSKINGVAGLPVCTSVGNSAFEGCVGLSVIGAVGGTIEIPSCISIGNRAFNGCAAITAVADLPACTTIGNSAFEGCGYLNTVGNLPACTYVGISAFRNCGNIRGIGGLPACGTIDAGAFEGCVGLSTIGEVSGTVDLPACTAIRESAFEGCGSIQKVGDLPSCTSIGGSAFKGCTRMNPVGELPSCGTIGANAFEGCIMLATVGSVGGTVSIPACTVLSDYAFKDCPELGVIKIPKGLTSIGTGAFGLSELLEEEVGLDSVVFEEGSECRVINDDAFANCTGLKYIFIPEGVTDVGSSFRNCSGLLQMYMPSTLTTIDGDIFEGLTLQGPDGQTLAKESYQSVIPGNIISKMGFKQLRVMPPEFEEGGLEYTVVCGETLTAKLTGFADPHSTATSVDIPENTVYTGTHYLYRVLEIADGAFSGRTMVESVSAIHVTHIGDRAFEGCVSLGAVELGEGLEYLGPGAFDLMSDGYGNPIPADFDGSQNPMVSYMAGKTFRGCNGHFTSGDHQLEVSFETPVQRLTVLYGTEVMQDPDNARTLELVVFTGGGSQVTAVTADEASPGYLFAGWVSDPVMARTYLTVDTVFSPVYEPGHIVTVVYDFGGEPPVSAPGSESFTVADGTAFGIDGIVLTVGDSVFEAGEYEGFLFELWTSDSGEATGSIVSDTGFSAVYSAVEPEPQPGPGPEPAPVPEPADKLVPGVYENPDGSVTTVTQNPDGSYTRVTESDDRTFTEEFDPDRFFVESTELSRQDIPGGERFTEVVRRDGTTDTRAVDVMVPVPGSSASAVIPVHGGEADLSVLDLAAEVLDKYFRGYDDLSVRFDTSSSVYAGASVSIASEGVADIGGSKLGIVFQGPDFVLEMDPEAVSAMSGRTVIGVRSAGAGDMTPEQVSASKGYSAFVVTVSCNGIPVDRFAGAVSVTVPFPYESEEVSSFHLETDGTMDDIDSVPVSGDESVRMEVIGTGLYVPMPSDAAFPEEPSGTDDITVLAAVILIALIASAVTALVLHYRK